MFILFEYSGCGFFGGSGEGEGGWEALQNPASHICEIVVSFFGGDFNKPYWIYELR